VPGLLRALVVSNMRPDRRHPERGSFVRDQVAALRALDPPLDVELYEFPPGARALARAARDLRRRFGANEPFDVVHAHFGLTAWPALALPAHVRALTLHGTDLHHPRTRLLTRAVLPRIDLLATVSPGLAEELPRRLRTRVEVLPCGVDLERFRPLPRAEARAELGLDPQRPYLLFAADPARPEKRYDLARGLAGELEVELLTLGGIAPARVPLWVNAVDAVLVPSEREGFGLAVLEALACNVPVLATPVGIHDEALAELPGTLCAPFDRARWRAALEPLLAREQESTVAPMPLPGGADSGRIAGRARAERFSATRMAERVVAAWRTTRLRAG
jgi:teichuronic acid biosynthesis glycosyltransferase TuaC